MGLLDIFSKEETIEVEERQGFDLSAYQLNFSELINQSLFDRVKTLLDLGNQLTGEYAAAASEIRTECEINLRLDRRAIEARELVDDLEVLLDEAHGDLKALMVELEQWTNLSDLADQANQVGWATVRGKNLDKWTLNAVIRGAESDPKDTESFRRAYLYYETARRREEDMKALLVRKAKLAEEQPDLEPDDTYSEDREPLNLRGQSP